MSTAVSEIDQIRRQMAQIRRELHDDVQGVVEGAEAATDWRRYVRSYPWASVGLAMAVGFLIVPRRHRAPAPIQLVAPLANGVARAEAPRPAEPEKKKGKSLLGAAFGMLVPIALRAGQGYAMQFAEQWLAQKMAAQVQMHPDLAAVLGGQPERPQGPRAEQPGRPRF